MTHKAGASLDESRLSASGFELMGQPKNALPQKNPSKTTEVAKKALENAYFPETQQAWIELKKNFSVTQLLKYIFEAPFILVGELIGYVCQLFLKLLDFILNCPTSFKFGEELTKSTVLV